MNQPLVSIIVPIYNTEAYLERCLNSIRNQDYENLEVWLVNDGSTDNSLSLCYEMVGEDAKFHIISSEENRGVSETRNRALDLATGQYLQFVDSDDYMSPSSTKTMVQEAETSGADLVIAHFFRESKDQSAPKGHIREKKLLTRQEFAEEMMKAPANFYYGVLWNKLYRRNLVEANQLRFEVSLNWCEDFLFNLEYIKYIRMISAVPIPVYHYVKRKDSLVTTESTLRNTIKTKRITFSYYKQLYQQLDLYEQQKAGVYRYLIAAAKDWSSAGRPKFMAGQENSKTEKAEKNPQASEVESGKNKKRGAAASDAGTEEK